MVQSMTAFARKQIPCGRGVLVWEIRSVNHRYLETGFRFPEALRSLEPAVRDALRKTLSRGKVDCQLRIESEERQNGGAPAQRGQRPDSVADWRRASPDGHGDSEMARCPA